MNPKIKEALKKVLLTLSLLATYAWVVTKSYESELPAILGITILTIFVWRKVKAKFFN